MNSFLTCDAPDCDHREDVEALSKDLIDKPCPKCGASLLTEADYKVWCRMMFVIRFFRILGLTKERKPNEPQPEGLREVSINYHNGKTTIKETDDETA